MSETKNDKVHTIELREYTVANTANFKQVASRMDQALIEYFSGKNVLIRCLDLTYRPEKTRRTVIDSILKNGTDVTELTISSIGRDKAVAELCAFTVNNPVSNGKNYFYCPVLFSPHLPNIIWDFYNYELSTTSRRRRIDLALIYDADQMVNVAYLDDRFPDMRRTDGFNFVHPADKPAALLGILNFL